MSPRPLLGSRTRCFFFLDFFSVGCCSAATIAAGAATCSAKGRTVQVATRTCAKNRGVKGEGVLQQANPGARPKGSTLGQLLAGGVGGGARVLAATSWSDARVCDSGAEAGCGG